MTVVFDDDPDDDWPFDWTPPVAARQPLPPGPSDRHELGDGQGRVFEQCRTGLSAFIVELERPLG